MPLFKRPAVGVTATALGRSALPPEIALPVLAELPLPALFVRWGPFPAVRAVAAQTGAWDQVGASRRPQLGDGGEVTERIVEFRQGVGFAYELTGFTDVFRHLVIGVRGEWSVLPDGDGSTVRWTWEFRPRAGRRALVAIVLVPLWQRYMRVLMRGATRLADRTAAAAPGGAPAD